MLPKSIPSVKEYEKIAKNFNNLSSIIIMVEKDSSSNINLLNIAKEISKSLYNIKFKNYKKPIGNVYYKFSSSYLTSHSFMMLQTSDLKTIIKLYSSDTLNLYTFIRNLNNSLEGEYIEDDEKISDYNNKNQIINFLNKINDFINTIQYAIYSNNIDSIINKNFSKFLTEEGIFYSNDKNSILIIAEPTLSFDNNMMDLIKLSYIVLDSLENIKNRYKNINIYSTGTTILGAEENKYVSKDMGLSSIIAIIIILIVLVISFKNWKFPLYASLILIVGLILTSGFIYIIFGRITILSAAFGLILIGLGIDFSIHYLSVIKEAYENNVKNPILFSFRKIFIAISMGALTTILVFLALILTKFDPLKELGLSVAIGIFTILVLTFMLLPTFIYNEKFTEYKIFNIFKRINFLEKWGEIIEKNKILNIIVLILVFVPLVGFIYSTYIKKQSLSFEYNMLKLEAKNMPSVIAYNKLLKKFDFSPDFAIFTEKNIDSLRKKIKKIKELNRNYQIIGMIESITELIPDDSTQAKNKILISNFLNRLNRKKFYPSNTELLIKELKRLHNNLVELGELAVLNYGENNKITNTTDKIVGKKDENSKILKLSQILKEPKNSKNLSKVDSLFFISTKNTLLSISDTSKIILEKIDKNLLKRYYNPNTKEFVALIYPNGDIWNLEYFNRFDKLTKSVVGNITGNPHMSFMFLNYMIDKGKLAVILSFIVIYLFLLIDFRSILLSTSAMGVVVLSNVYLIELLKIMDVKLNYMNLMALPLILGIGIDDSIHIIHRFLLKDETGIKSVLKHTGKAIFLTTLTTAIGFGSMGLSQHRGLASFGQALFIGIVSAFVLSITFLPIILNLLKKHIKKE